ncbi:winged helix-turn-helix domain-containing protein [Streptomyces ureilyticus]|jgi:DNA-binding transcriptional ArsR family regulator|uniref:Helix-turn-helix transcriptional regulator n=1 Tax=Streptomyces ureilyticus TaxID=1775131 RepID=A0ABX0E6B4_9ACTN|nr:winged helix-turn-helix domain-containing protein [Streptomyces ureilyticus]NGO46697.1 helix-turn-helix transcriptional regulator [Streptomyces ureilyticus]
MADDGTTDITLDTAALRVLAHPTRLALLNRLRQQGPATVRQLAAHFELDSGAASYHLRRLAAGGLIEEDTERGTKRDRWWRALHRISLHDPATAPDSADSRAYAQAVALADGETLRRVAAEVVPVLPDEWFGVSGFMSYMLRMTPGELDTMKGELLRVVESYREREPADGAERVAVHLQLFPLLADEA